MPLEATMMVIDNSEYMRNGDYLPTRFEAQSDAVNAIFQTKIGSNPENTVGIMTMAGKGPEVLVTHTKELGQIIKATHTVSQKISGTIDIPTSIAIAQLALKHRENKNLRQRIIVFVASPLDGAGADEKNMIKLAKKLKKNNVAVDIVSFGDGIEEGEKNVLKAFVENASSGDNSHLVSIPPGLRLLSDVLLSSPILSGDRGIQDDPMGDAGVAAVSGSGAVTGGDFDVFNVDPTLDPELAMALRLSLQEAEASAAAAAAASTSATTSDAPPISVTQPPGPTGVPADATGDEEAAMLQEALQMSKTENDIAMGDGDDEEMDEEEAIARAIEMSMRGEEENQEEKSTNE